MTEIEKSELKAEIIRERGYWSRFHDVLLDRAPDFLKAYLLFQAAPTRSGVLPQKLCEFIYIAIDMSVNHMYARGGQRHMEFALKAGATPDEILQVVLLTTVVSAHQPIDLGLDILREELGAALPESPADDDLARARTDYIATIGYWPEAGDTMLELSPDFARGYMAYGAAAWQAGPLPTVYKHLIALAICAAPTCLDPVGMQRHIKAALGAGATPAEISTVLQLAAAISVHTCTIGIPAFDDAMSGKTIE